MDKTLTLSKKYILWKSNHEHKFGKHIYTNNFQMKGALIGGASLNSTIIVSDILVYEFYEVV